MPCEPTRSESALAAIEVWLANHQSRVRVIRQTPRVDVENQDARTILNEQPLRLFIHDDLSAAELLPATALDHRVEVGLTDDVCRFRVVLHSVGMDVKDEDPAAVSHEEPLMNIVHRQARLGTASTVGAIRDRLSPPAEQTAVPNNVVGRVTNVPAVFIQLVDEDPDVAWLRDEHAVIDAIQRHRPRSPHAVGVGSVVGHTTAGSGVTPRVELQQHVAGRLASFLPADGNHRQPGHREHERPSSKAHRSLPLPRIICTVSWTSLPDGL